MSIRPLPFANALAVTTAALAVFLLVLRIATPRFFIFVFNAQFFGADVASLLPAQIEPFSIIGELIAFIGGAWLFGFFGAVLYNRFTSAAS